MEAREITDVSWTRTSQANRLVIMVKDPTTLFAYWEVDDLHKRIICEHFHTDWARLQLLLHVYDVTDILFDGGNAHSTQRIQVHPDCDNWYITELHANRRYLVDLGTFTGQWRFFPILRSNVVGTPPQANSSKLEPSLRFATVELTPEHQMYSEQRLNNEQLPSEDRAAASTAGLRPFQRDETWRHQFDGYHLTGQKGADA